MGGPFVASLNNSRHAGYLNLLSSEFKQRFGARQLTLFSGKSSIAKCLPRRIEPFNFGLGYA